MGRAKVGNESTNSKHPGTPLLHDANMTLTSLSDVVAPTTVVAMQIVVALVVAMFGGRVDPDPVDDIELLHPILAHLQRCHGETCCFCCYGCGVDPYGGETRLLITQTI